MVIEDIEDEFVTLLLLPDEQQHHIGQVESLTTKNITFLKSKFVSRSGCELIDYPMAECVGIEYRDERSVFTMIAGGFLVLLIAAIAYLLAAMWDDLTPGLQIPVGAMAVGAGVGLRWTFMSRRHKFVFEMKDGTKLKWRSRSGDFKYKVGQANKIVTFANEAGLLRSKA